MGFRSAATKRLTTQRFAFSRDKPSAMLNAPWQGSNPRSEEQVDFI